MNIDRERRELLHRLPLVSSSPDETIQTLCGRLNSTVHSWMARMEQLCSFEPLDPLELTWQQIEALRSEHREAAHSLWCDGLLLLAERVAVQKQIIALLDQHVADTATALTEARSQAIEKLRGAGLSGPDLNRAAETTDAVKSAVAEKAAARDWRTEMERERGVNLDVAAVERLRKEISRDFENYVRRFIGMFSLAPTQDRKVIDLWQRPVQDPPRIVESEQAEARPVRMNHKPIPALRGPGPLSTASTETH